MNEEEKILRDYLFHFLRSADYKTDVNFYLPKFLVNDPAFAETQRTLSWEHEQYRLKVIDFAKQFHPQTATWGLNIWEEELGLATDLTVDLELRRAKVMAKLLGTSPMTVANTNKLVNLFTDDGKAYVDELPEDGVIKVIIPSKTVHLDEMRNSLDEMLPAHLAYDFQHVITIDDDDDDGESGKPDKVIEVNDESTADTGESAFFMHAEFPTVENIPYGKPPDAPMYDGSVQVKPLQQHGGDLQYSGIKTYDGIDSATSKVGAYRQWWFIPTGNSTFNKEFQNNGAIRYDSWRPQDIEFDNGMDELDIIKLTQIADDEILNFAQFDGVVANANSIDSSGELEVKRFKHFNGAVNYNGGDLNYFNGAIKADGNFDFDGKGIKAQVEILSDGLDGDLSYSEPVKETPLSDFYPEIFDFVQRTFDSQSTEIVSNGFDENLNIASDTGSTLAVSKGVHYNGAKVYNGGNINYFDGAIKADGNFDFNGDGNRAKIEVIAFDLDNSLTLSRIQKSVPIPYVETFDYVSKTYDNTKFAAQINLGDFAEPSDISGDLIIGRRLKFDGYSSYRGNFSYIESSKKRFNGNLNYCGINQLISDGAEKFNGAELYGGRNYKFIDIIDNLDGNLEILNDVEKIPIATHTKLGLVIIGNNLDVDDNGKISMPQDLMKPDINPVESGKLRTIFENRRR